MAPNVYKHIMRIQCSNFKSAEGLLQLSCRSCHVSTAGWSVILYTRSLEISYFV